MIQRAVSKAVVLGLDDEEILRRQVVTMMRKKMGSFERYFTCHREG